MLSLKTEIAHCARKAIRTRSNRSKKMTESEISRLARPGRVLDETKTAITVHPKFVLSLKEEGAECVLHERKCRNATMWIVVVRLLEVF